MHQGSSTPKSPEQSGLNNLPSLPQAVLKLLEVCQGEEPSLEQLLAVVSKDPVLSAKVIATASSGLLRTDERLADLEGALVALGHDAVKGIAISTAIFQISAEPGPIGSDALKELWHHAYSCAVAARLLAELTDYASPGEAYLSGLLHNLGQLVLAGQASAARDYVQVALADDKRLIEVEQEQFGTSHCSVGASLIGTWNLRSFMADAVRYHHEPASRLLDAHDLVKITNLANSLTRHREEHWEDILDSARRLFGISGSEVSDLLHRLRTEVERAAEFLDIAATPETRYMGVVSEQVKRELLAKRVFNVALLDGLGQSLARASSEVSIIKSIYEWLDILFSIRSGFLFLHDSEERALFGYGEPDQTGLIGSLHIPVEEGRSLVSTALLDANILTSFRSGARELLSVIDQQIIRLTGKDGMMCVPLISDETAIGTLILGLDEVELPKLERQADVMRMVAKQAARAIHTHRNRTDKRRQTESDTKRRIESGIQQLVHEAGNPLSIINNYLELLDTRLGEEHPAQEDLKILREEIRRVQGIMLRLSDISKIGEAGPELVSISEVISELTRVFQGSLFATRQIEADVTLDSGVPPILSSRDGIKEVLTNLIRNAVEAVPVAGRVSIRTHDKVVLDGEMYVEVTVSDTGPGISPNVLEKLFSPVTSTKGDGHAGLGLSIVRSRVKELGGFVSCTTEKDVGTTFSILLPRITNPAEQKAIESRRTMPQ